MQVAALDLGTTKFCLATLNNQGRTSPHSINMLSVDADGMHRGMLSDFEKARKALMTLITLAEGEQKTSISKIAVGIAGSHLKSDTFLLHKSFPPRRLDEAFLQKANLEAMASKNQHGMITLHTVPVAYKPDNREWMENPCNFQCASLKVKYFRISADRHYVSDIITLCNQLGLEIRSVYAEPWASSQICLNSKQKKEGVMLADIGGGTTDGIIFQNQHPAGLFTVNIGGILMTRDLSVGLKVPYQRAEQIKFSRGLHSGCEGTTSEGFWVDKILGCRIRELAHYLRKEMLLVSPPLPSKIILTGGGSGVKGLSHEFSKILKVPVQVVSPDPDLLPEGSQFIPGQEFVQLRHPKFATVSGMLILELKNIIRARNPGRYHYAERFFRQICHWIRELS